MPSALSSAKTIFSVLAAIPPCLAAAIRPDAGLGRQQFPDEL
jgi:hypothetical protein